MNVNSGYTDFRHDLVTKACADRGWECRVEHTTIGAIMDDILDDGDTPCSLCARLRRGVLYRLAAEVGATKIALGHHLDDFVETALLNLFFQGSLKAMPARLVSDNRKHIVIRPLVYVTEAEARGYTQEYALPVIGCCCPACGDLSLKRQRIKRLHRRARARAPGHQEFDDQGAQPRRAHAPAGHAAEPGRPDGGGGRGAAPPMLGPARPPGPAMNTEGEQPRRG